MKIFLFATVSAMTLASTSAPAQNTNISSCSNGSPANECIVSQGADANRNFIDLRVDGGGNIAFVEQHTGTQARTAATITGNENHIGLYTSGALNTSEMVITGNRNGGDTQQGGSQNTAQVSIIGADNTWFTTQGYNAGSKNYGYSELRGNSLSALIVQDRDVASAADNWAVNDLRTSAPSTEAGVRNQSSTIHQSERGNNATVVIRGGDATSTGRGQQSSYIRQGNNVYNSAIGSLGTVNELQNPWSGNVADVSIAGVAGNSSDLRQNGLSNNAQISIAKGGHDVTSIGGGMVDGLTFPASRRDGNASRVTQNGRGNSVAVSFGGRLASDGRGNTLVLSQGQGLASTSAPGQLNVAALASAIGREHSATVYQFGRMSDVVVHQDDNDVNGTAAGGGQFASTADISQSALASRIELHQLGRNAATISQGGGVLDTGLSTSGNNSLRIEQVQSGDPSFQGTTVNEARVSQSGRLNNGYLLQNATGASATLFQRRGTEASRIEVRQGAGDLGGSYYASAVSGSTAGVSSDVSASVVQGGRESIINVRQDGSKLTIDVTQNAVNSSAEVASNVWVSQVGSQNRSVVQQTGSGSVVAVDQRNASTGPSSSFIEVKQSGGLEAAGNIALARQTSRGSGVATLSATEQTGPAGDPDGRLAGSTMANTISIDQTGLSNHAEVEQQGAGQVARIQQAGNNNEARILQTSAAINSTGIIIQNGNGNVFGITQDRSNQFYRIVQSGTGNMVTQAGPNGGGTTGTPVFAPAP